MSIVCCIRYVIDPFQAAAFEAYARTNNIALALLRFDSLAAYEAYRARIRADDAGSANFRDAQEKRFILSEERTFLRTVEA
jgi:hypothetical protein